MLYMLFVCVIVISVHLSLNPIRKFRKENDYTLAASKKHMALLI